MKNRKGFTLAELLIVVAIIAVLVAISIPIFTGQMEKAREAADAANIRAQYAEVMAQAMSDAKSVNLGGTKRISLTQKRSGWQTEQIEKSLAGIAVVKGDPGTQAWTEYDADTGIVSIRFEKAGQGAGSTPAFTPLINGFNEWEKIHDANIGDDGKAILSSSYQDSVLKIGGEGSSKQIKLEAGKKYKLVIDVEACGADLTVRLSNRNGNKSYLEGTITEAGKVEYEYSHISGLDDDVRISLEVLKGQQRKENTVIRSVTFTEIG